MSGKRGGTRGAGESGAGIGSSRSDRSARIARGRTALGGLQELLLGRLQLALDELEVGLQRGRVGVAGGHLVLQPLPLLLRLCGARARLERPMPD